jgi:hypothetical protein
MGYETTLLIGKSTDALKEDTASFFHTYATIDLCKCGEGALDGLESHHKGDPLVYWYYGTDGNHHDTEDRYGDKPVPLSINEVLQALYKHRANDNYRRFKWAIALLESMQHDSGENLQVLFYGH